MNTLPAHRQIINARTFSSPWSPASMDPIERPAPRSWVPSVALCIFLGVLLGALLVEALS